MAFPVQKCLIPGCEWTYVYVLTRAGDPESWGRMLQSALEEHLTSHSVRDWIQVRSDLIDKIFRLENEKRNHVCPTPQAGPHPGPQEVTQGRTREDDQRVPGPAPLGRIRVYIHCVGCGMPFEVSRLEKRVSRCSRCRPAPGPQAGDFVPPDPGLPPGWTRGRISFDG